MAQNIVDYSQDHEYRHESGVTIVPRAVGTPVLISLHQPYTVRESRWASSSINAPPRVPRQEDVGETVLYVGGTVSAPLPIPNNGADGYVWNMSGQYTYLCLTPLVLDGATDLPTGEYPTPIPAIEAFQNSDTTFDLDDNSLMPWPYTVFPGNCAVASLISGGFATKELVGGVVYP